MSSNETQNKTKWILKFTLSFLSIVGGIDSVLHIILPLFPYKLNQYIIPIGMSSLITGIIFSIGLSFYWHYKEKNNLIDSQKYYIWLTTILRYWLAFYISTFGFEKLFDVNFAYSYHIEDALVNTLTGQELTWKYYGHSYYLTVIIGLFQIIGSILLLFRRTTLLGVLTLLPVQINILLINLFYGIGPLTTFTSIIMVIGLSYLSLERKEEIIDFFRRYKSTLPTVGNTTLRKSIRFLCILIPFLFVFYYSYDVRKSQKYFGKWKVESMTRNGRVILENEWQKDTLAWKTLYIEERGKMYFCPNPHIYLDSTSLLMKYQYDDDKNQNFKVISFEKNRNKPDTIPVQISKFKDKSMQWKMILYKDTIQMELKKVNL
ncbi:hypothetical protein [Flavobacterium sp. 123]|uniref:hypothetical protein n=1 Tax=Flavobacterium sp. 123 TaxID=2135627 RepID=UPI000EAE6916|nr:hypothetical protein [Flavobacterium sp. 123]RKT00383.1 hypothetical protein C8C88_2210 [Flavobacterium sp. 123]